MITFKPDLSRIPSHYEIIETREDRVAYRHNGLVVIISGAIENDNKRWVHVSFSWSYKIPEYKDMMKIKKDFIGENKKAIMIFPEGKNNINKHLYCLHLWHCLDGDGIPEFIKHEMI